MPQPTNPAWARIGCFYVLTITLSTSDAFGDVLPARKGSPWAHVDDLDRLAGGDHLFHLLDGDRRRERARSGF